MSRIADAVSTALLLAMSIGLARAAVMQIEGLFLALLALAMLMLNVTFVRVILRTFSWRGALGWMTVSVVVGSGGFFAGPPLMRLSLIRNLVLYEQVANRCAGAGVEFCKLLAAEREYVDSVTRDRFLPYSTIAVSPVGWYVFVVRPENEVAHRHLASHPCVRHLKGHWYIEYRC